MASALISTTPDFDNLMNPVNIQDPFPLYGWLRVHSPVHWNRYLGTWMLTRFEDVRSAFGDPLRFGQWRAASEKSVRLVPAGESQL